MRHWSGGESDLEEVFGGAVGGFVEVERLPFDGWHLVRPCSPRRAIDPAAIVADLGRRFPGAFVTPLFIDTLGGPRFSGPDLFVRFREIRDVATVVALLRPLVGAEVEIREFASLPGLFRIIAPAADGWNLTALSERLSRLPEVEWAEPDLYFSAAPAYVPSDPGFDLQWPLHARGQPIGYMPSPPLFDMDMDLPEAWDLTQGSASLHLAILDDGVVHDHPDLPPFFGIDTTSQGPGDGGPITAFDVHGTLVAGVIAAVIDNGRGIAGVAPGIRITSVRAFISTSYQTLMTSSSWTLAALNWCLQNDVKITNTSLTLGASPAAVTAKFDQLRQAGILHFGAAGNAANPNVLAYPAGLPSVISVASIDHLGALSVFSNSGPGLDLVAPGESVLTTDFVGTAGQANDDYAASLGTTFSCAHASAVAALAWSIDLALTADQIESIIRLSATDLGASGPDATFGHGRIEAYASAFTAAWMSADPTKTLFANRGSAPAERFGGAVVSPGDLDGDGIPEYAVGAPDSDTSGIHAGRVDLFDGATGAAIASYFGSIAGEGFGSALGAADIDADGIGDLLIGAPSDSSIGAPTARLCAISGATGAVLWNRPYAADAAFASAIAVLDDSTGDGTCEIAVGAPQATVNSQIGAGIVFILDGATGTILAQISADVGRGERGFGAALLDIDDRDGDGRRDLLIGAPESALPSPMCGAVVTARVPLGGSIVRWSTLDGLLPFDEFGRTLAAIPDTDGDGKDELLIGAPGAAGHSPGAGAIFGVGSIGGIAAPVILGDQTGDRLGASLLICDVDDDSQKDIVVGIPGDDRFAADAGRITVFSGADGRKIYDLAGGRAGQRLGASLAGAGDIDADGGAEVLAGSPGDAASLDPGSSVIFPAPRPERRARRDDPARRGTVTDLLGRPIDCLFVNGSAGGLDRHVTVAIDAPLFFSFAPPEGLLQPAPFAIYGFVGDAAPTDVFPLFEFGLMAFPPCPLYPGYPGSFTMTSNVFPDSCAELGSAPGPWTYSYFPGLSFPITFTLQAVFLDDAFDVFITNALIFEVR